LLMRTPRRVLAAQVKELRRELNQGASLRRAAMRAAMHRKAAQKYRELNQFPHEARQPHTWRTRLDPLVEVWLAVAEQLDMEPGLQAKTLCECLQQTHVGKCPESIRRTTRGLPRPHPTLKGMVNLVFFTQEHAPGRLAASDFTGMNKVQATIAGGPFAHLLLHFVLTYSTWDHRHAVFGRGFCEAEHGYAEMRCGRCERRRGGIGPIA
jgi:hypothetical protein